MTPLLFAYFCEVILIQRGAMRSGGRREGPFGCRVGWAAGEYDDRPYEVLYQRCESYLYY